MKRRSVVFIFLNSLLLFILFFSFRSTIAKASVVNMSGNIIIENEISIPSNTLDDFDKQWLSTETLNPDSRISYHEENGNIIIDEALGKDGATVSTSVG